ncbi:MAG: cysteine synthase family protein [Anaerolineae bacterium]|nr:cysteine synthase family protein [Anaerolineae bacterium]
MLQTIDRAAFSSHTHTLSHHTLEGQVGNTPLLSLARIAEAAGVSPRVRLFAKAEWFNPSGSVKDRPALNIIRTAEREELLRPGMTLLDSTSGNMGIAYAMLGTARGYGVRLVVPESVSPERIAVLRAYGVDLVLTDALEGVDGALQVARSLAAEDADVFYANQYDNPANWRAHYDSTANEIWKQTGACITHFVTGLGTSGTFMGTTRRLRELDPAITAIALQPEAAFNGIEGMKHMATAIRPAIFDESEPDDVRIVRTEEAYAMARRLAREQGVFVGASAGANVAGALAVAAELDEGVVVTVLPDSGFKYLSERFWQE